MGRNQQLRAEWARNAQSVREEIERNNEIDLGDQKDAIMSRLQKDLDFCSSMAKMTFRRRRPLYRNMW